jgi:hypothetical protein
MDASGTVAGAIVFSRWRGRNYVRRHAIPSNPRTALQTGIRSAFRFLTQGWDNIDDPTKALWNDVGDVTRVTGLNALVAENIRRLRQGTVWKYTPTFLSPNAPGNVASFVPTALSRAIQLDWAYATATSYEWGVEIHMSTSGGFVPSIASLIYALPYPTVQLIVTGLTPGVPYYFRARSFGSSYMYGAMHAEVVETPLA